MTKKQERAIKRAKKAKQHREAALRGGSEREVERRRRQMAKKK